MLIWKVAPVGKIVKLKNTYLTLVKLPPSFCYFQVRIFGLENREKNVLLEQRSHTHIQKSRILHSAVNWFLMCYISLDRAKYKHSFILVRVHSEILSVKNDRWLREIEN